MGKLEEKEEKEEEKKDDEEEEEEEEEDYSSPDKEHLSVLCIKVEMFLSCSFLIADDLEWIKHFLLVSNTYLIFALHNIEKPHMVAVDGFYSVMNHRI
ncbi:hypothetical protein Anas_07482 [Armadillidium nasatum]|uniref:Uncharacterized protein n=1 Tax=Armadillidium nasatum TaxID=96803 RepID=A0A5N5TEY3_9CRUS|nr:hypothetical protein Anas_07482 [Armadillidium nasatum]